MSVHMSCQSYQIMISWIHNVPSISGAFLSCQVSYLQSFKKDLSRSILAVSCIVTHESGETGHRVKRDRIQFGAKRAGSGNLPIRSISPFNEMFTVYWHFEFLWNSCKHFGEGRDWYSRIDNTPAQISMKTTSCYLLEIRSKNIKITWMNNRQWHEWIKTRIKTIRRRCRHFVVAKTMTS